MALELGQVAAGFPLAASFAIAGGLALLREGRRRSSLNEAVHELRRPLQVLALSLSDVPRADRGLDSSLRMAAAALERLDREINGGALAGEIAAISPRPLVEAAVERWQPRAAREDRSLSLLWQAGNALLRGEAVELGQALDNMISNAFEHGSGPVAVEVKRTGGVLRLAVRDGGHLPARSARGARPRAWLRLSGRSRHGHGLRVARRAAARHGGGFRLSRSSNGAEALLELPLAGEGR